MQKARSSGPGLLLVDLISRYSKLQQPHESPDLQRILGAAQQGRSGQPAKVRDLGRRLGQAKIDQLAADYQSGTPTTQLMAEYGISKASVLKLLADAGVPMRRQPLTAAQVTEAVDLYQAGLSLAKVSELLTLPHESVRRALIDAGVRMRSRSQIRN